MKRFGLIALLTAMSVPMPAHGQAKTYAPERPFGTLRQQAKVQQMWLAERLETVLPRLMREHGVDMWVVAMREYNEDPVFRALVSPTMFAARRRTINIFYDRGEPEGVERLALYLREVGRDRWVERPIRAKSPSAIPSGLP